MNCFVYLCRMMWPILVSRSILNFSTKMNLLMRKSKVSRPVVMATITIINMILTPLLLCWQTFSMETTFSQNIVSCKE